jgi:CDP-diacylglycerol--serine O-phosphatidyltransferase
VTSPSSVFPRGRFLVPNAASAANIVAGFCSMLATAHGKFDLAVYCLVAAVLLDMMDGRLARWLDATSKFGQEIDSFSDTISFCTAPAFLAYNACLTPLGVWGVAVSLVYVLAGVFRLARFNLTSDEHAKASRTLGVTTPVGAGYLMALALMRAQVPPLWAAALVLVVAAAMVSTWRLPDLKGRSVVTAMLIVGVLNYFAVVLRPGWPTVIWWNVWNVAILVAAKVQDRRQAGA